jgi:hypothetical protein
VNPHVGTVTGDPTAHCYSATSTLMLHNGAVLDQAPELCMRAVKLRHGGNPTFHSKSAEISTSGFPTNCTRLRNAVSSGRNRQRLECGQLNKLIDEVLQKMGLNHLIAAFAVVHYDKARPPSQ